MESPQQDCAPINSQDEQANWEQSDVNLLLEIMVAVKGQNGMWGAKHFSQEGWKVVVKEFTASSGCFYSSDQIKQKYQRMRKDWKIMHWLLTQNSGVGWDPVKCTITATPENWRSMITVSIYGLIVHNPA